MKKLVSLEEYNQFTEIIFSKLETYDKIKEDGEREIKKINEQIKTARIPLDEAIKAINLKDLQVQCAKCQFPMYIDLLGKTTESFPPKIEHECKNCGAKIFATYVEQL